MKQLTDALRFVVISPELLVIASLLLIGHTYPDLATVVGDKLIANTEITSVLLGFPIALFLWTYPEAKSILFPKDNNKVLIEWNDYPLLRNRVYYSLFLQIVCVVASAILFLFKSDIESRIFAVGLVMILGVLLCIAISLAMASMQIRQIIEKEI
jgi:hypothetical protein